MNQTTTPWAAPRHARFSSDSRRPEALRSAVSIDVTVCISQPVSLTFHSATLAVGAPKGLDRFRQLN